MRAGERHNLTKTKTIRECLFSDHKPKKLVLHLEGNEERDCEEEDAGGKVGEFEGGSGGGEVS